MKALIADDESISRTLLERGMQKCGYEVVSVADGQAALDALRGDPSIRLAILDWMMPNMDGPEVCRALRGDPALPFVYVILLTAKSEQEDIVEGLEAGTDDYLVKPFDLDELCARVGVGARQIRLQEERDRATRALDALARTDALTGLPNRRAILEGLESELARCAREAKPIAIYMLDVDRFKRINDERGHAAGDEALKEIAGRLARCARAYDGVGRLGGEEFIAFAPGAPREAAGMIGERLRAAVASEPIRADGATIPASISIGAIWLPAGRAAGADELLKAADALLYKAKESGRDRVEFGEFGG